MCKGTFADVFLTPPPGLRSTLVSAECPRLCSKCPVNIPHLLSHGGANVPSISETSRAVRAIGGEIFDKEIPAGENLEYRAPRTLAGYKDMVDGTSYAAEARKGREGKGCRRIFQVGSRGDMRTTVKPMLEELGVCVHLVQGCRPLRRHRPIHVLMAPTARAAPTQPAAPPQQPGLRGPPRLVPARPCAPFNHQVRARDARRADEGRRAVEQAVGDRLLVLPPAGACSRPDLDTTPSP